ncbi:MAG: hypothetical protein KDE58_31255, partial [Caldilineaceae bacterium]|nr:hypothetical protein [Caldilineaceae bacterium]
MHIPNRLPGAVDYDNSRASFIYIMGLLGLTGLILFALSDFEPEAHGRWSWLGYGLALQACAALAWVLEGRWPHFSRFLTTLLLASFVLWGVQSTFGTTFLFLLAIPVLVAFGLLGIVTALGIALLETTWVLSHGATIEQLPALVALWLILIIVYLIIHPIQETAAWAWRHYALLRQRLDAERDYKADLTQALQDLLQANRQLDLLNERLGAMRQLAEEANKSKTTFVAKVSHEFRTPLNMIIGLIDLVVQTPDLYGNALAPALLDDLQIVQRNCRHLAGMIDDVLDLSQTEAGRLVLHQDWHELHSAIEDAVDVVTPLLEKKQLALHLDIETALPQIYCDMTRIRQVILNLLSNAARYTAAGQIDIGLW